MSEAEIKKRQDYKRNRRKWMIIQIVSLAVMVIIAFGSFITYDQMNKTYYIEYTESSDIDYKVQYASNSFFEDEWIGEGQSYISSLINSISADFKYKLNMGAENVGFDYSYGVSAKLLVTDKDTGKHVFSPEYELVPVVNDSIKRGNSLSINQHVPIDFNEYNSLATHFINIYGLKNVSSMLVVSMKVDVISQCEEFENNNQNSYTTSMSIPLTSRTFTISTSTSVPTAESKVLACSGSINQNVFKIVGFITSALAILLAGILVAFMYLTRNEDINYAIKVQKLVSAYRSFIQQIDGEFDIASYQTVHIKTFNEMLGIRDTIQSPILMSENRDQTMTQFIIPTSTSLLYVFEIKVDNYDEIYGLGDTVEEAIIIDDSVDIDEVAEAMAEPDVLLSEVEYVEDDDVDYEGTEEHPGVEVVGVVWPERAHKNKVYRYDPNGEQLAEGDMVLVPTHDAGQGKDVIRKAAIAHENHFIDPDLLKHPLKKIIGVIKRKTQAALTPADNTENEPSSEA